MAEPPNVALTLTNTPQSVWLVREMLSGVAEVVELDTSDLDDVRTAVTEACNNVALHAYVGARGPLEVEVYTRLDALQVVVRDRGIGIPSHLLPTGKLGSGLGLQIMRALTRDLELRATGGGSGSEAKMEFATPGALALRPPPSGCLPTPTAYAPASVAMPNGLSGTTAVSVAPATLAGAVLRRVLSVIAASTHFSTDRISDMQLLADALAADPHSSSAHCVSLAVEVEHRDLRLSIGPLDTGAAQQLLAACPIRGLGPLIETLTDAHYVRSAGHFETLSLQVRDRRQEADS